MCLYRTHTFMLNTCIPHVLRHTVKDFTLATRSVVLFYTHTFPFCYSMYTHVASTLVLLEFVCAIEQASRKRNWWIDGVTPQHHHFTMQLRWCVWKHVRSVWNVKAIFIFLYPLECERNHACFCMWVCVVLIYEKNNKART